MIKNIEVSGMSYELIKFPGGEINVRFTEPLENPTAMITAHLKSSDDIMTLLLVSDALKRLGVWSIELVIPYFPYARQDRVCNEGEALSCKVMADLINSIGAVEVTIYDPHSDVTPALINNVNIIEQHTKIPLDILEGKLLVCPDAGAEKKIQKLKRSYVMCTKQRNPVTGVIVETTVDTKGYHLTGRDLLIVDDICDGGRTFIEISKVLKQHNPRSVHLYVTHGIFSKGLEVLDEHFDSVTHLMTPTQVVTHVNTFDEELDDASN